MIWRGDSNPAATFPPKGLNRGGKSCPEDPIDDRGQQISALLDLPRLSAPFQRLPALVLRGRDYCRLHPVQVKVRVRHQWPVCSGVQPLCSSSGNGRVQLGCPVHILQDVALEPR